LVWSQTRQSERREGHAAKQSKPKPVSYEIAPRCATPPPSSGSLSSAARIKPPLLLFQSSSSALQSSQRHDSGSCIVAQSAGGICWILLLPFRFFGSCWRCALSDLVRRGLLWGEGDSRDKGRVESRGGGKGKGAHRAWAGSGWGRGCRRPTCSASWTAPPPPWTRTFSPR
jgi:hypothetical protein